MSTTKHLQIVAQMYDIRAPIYDQSAGFHSKQQADYLRWIDLKPGYDALDLACGTGSLAIAAKQAVGSTGRVVGVDISAASLEIARSKAVSSGLEVELIESDICTFQDTKTFGVITCPAAYFWLETPGDAVRGWVKLLKQGGRLIFDTPTNDGLIRGLIFERAAQAVDTPLGVSRASINSLEKIKILLIEAGLDATSSFDTQNYDDPQTLDSAKAGNLFDGMVVPRKRFSGWYGTLGVPGIRDRARESLSREILKLADSDGKVESYLRFHMAVGKKI